MRQQGQGRSSASNDLPVSRSEHSAKGLSHASSTIIRGTAAQSDNKMTTSML
jgi:hypothetical protein